MGTRLERLQKRKISLKIKRRKRFIILLVILVLFIGLKTVDRSFVQFLQVENQRLFEYSYFDGTYRIQLMGDIYSIKKSDIDMYYEKFKTLVFNYVNQIKDFVVEFFKKEPGLSPVF